MMSYGVDFRGGAEVQLKFQQEIKLPDLRRTIKDAGFRGAVVQSIGEAGANEFLVKIQAEEDDLNQVTQDLQDNLNKTFASAGVEIRKIDIVGAHAGAQLRISGFQAMLWA